MVVESFVRWAEDASAFWENAADDSVDVNAVVSYSSQSQTGEGFEELVNSLNSDNIKRKIHHVNIWDTSYLYRHTIPEFSIYSDTSLVTKWQMINENAISKIEKPLTIHSWFEGLEAPEFKAWLDKINIAFAGTADDESVIVKDFRDLVLSEAEAASMQGKGTFAQNVRFILEECAYTCLYFDNGNILYPYSLSPPVAFVIKYYKSNIRHLSYRLSNRTIRHRHQTLNRNEVNYKIIEFITKVAKNVNFFVINRNGEIMYKNESLGKLVSESDATILSPDTWKNSIEVMKTKAIVTLEEIDKGRHFMSVKSPLIINEEVAGVIGLSIDITDTKKIELEQRRNAALEFINNMQQIEINLQNEYTNFISKMAHDIRSPLLVLDGFVKKCDNLSHQEQEQLKRIVSSIKGIANDLLQKYKSGKNELSLSKKNIVLISEAVQDEVNQKKMQYADNGDEHNRLSISFSCDNNAKNAFVNVSLSDFGRALSNLIDNAVEAIDKDSEGRVNVRLRSDNESLFIDVEDNGSGIEPNVIEEINSEVPLKSTKKSGFGLGLVQVIETARQNGGKLTVSSVVNKGTTFTLAFPLVDAPEWMITKLKLQEDDYVFVLNEDPIVNDMWENMLKMYLVNFSVTFFTDREKMLDALNDMPAEKKQRGFIFAAYEPGNEKFSDEFSSIISEGLGKQLIVVTGTPNDFHLHDLVKRTKAKIFPKQFIRDIQII